MALAFCFSATQSRINFTEIQTLYICMRFFLIFLFFFLVCQIFNFNEQWIATFKFVVMVEITALPVKKNEKYAGASIDYEKLSKSCIKHQQTFILNFLVLVSYSLA